MISYLHKALFLRREDAYTEFCHSVDKWGAYQPSSYAYLSFEEFHDKIKNNDIQLINSDSEAIFPSRQRERQCTDFYGLVTRVENKNDVEIIHNFLRRKRNVLVLIPVGRLYSHTLKKDPIVEALHRLDMQAYIPMLDQHFFEHKQVWWKEISVPSGRLFLSLDHFISDAFFIDDFVKSIENDYQINGLIQEFSVQSEPHIGITWKNQIDYWFCHEPYKVSFSVKNHGNTEIEDDLFMVPRQSVDIYTPLHFSLPPLKPLDNLTLACEVKFRIEGNHLPIESISLKNNPDTIISLDLPSTNILSSTIGGSRSYLPIVGDLSKLKDIYTNFDLKLYDEIYRLTPIDPASALNKMRKAVEKLASTLIHRNQLAKRSNLHNKIDVIKKAGILSEKAIGYFNTIRLFGNLASHYPECELINDRDVRVSAYALALIVEELIEKKLI